MDKNTKLPNKYLKKGKLFAIHHLTRRVQQLKNKRGTEQQVEKNKRKANRLQEEIEYIKDFEVIDVISKIESEPDVLENCIAMDHITDIQERALVRLISSKPIQSQVKQEKNVNSKKSNTIPTEEKSTENISAATPKRSRRLQNATFTENQLSSEEKHESLSENSDDDDILERTPTSLFVKNMSSLMDKTEKSTSKKKEKATKKSSNRLGQRARQRLWEKQYGKSAKHIKTGINGKKKGKLAKETKKEKRSPKKDKSQKTTAKQATANHPSWEASKRRKQQQNISETKFQGQKILFDDSD